MSITRLTDVATSVQFQRSMLAESLRRSALFNSGIVTPDSEISRLCAANVGKTFTFDYFNDLSDTEANVSGDDPAVSATADKIAATQYTGVKIMRNKGWGAANLVASLSTVGDPMVAIMSRVSAYWARQYDLSTIAIVKGLIIDNIAHNSGDMINDISGVSSGQKPTFIALADTGQTLGDAQDQLTTCVMHSAVKNVLLKDQVTDKVFDANGNLLYEQILNWRIITSDSVNNSAGVYDTYVFKGGAIGFGLGAPRKPQEIEILPSAGNGEGTETYWNRNHFCLHPYGFNWANGSVAGNSPTNAELALDANWARVDERKRIGLAVLRSKLANAA